MDLELWVPNVLLVRLCFVLIDFRAMRKILPPFVSLPALWVELQRFRYDP